jgi:hypothetical protein
MSDDGFDDELPTSPSSDLPGRKQRPSGGQENVPPNGTAVLAELLPKLQGLMQQMELGKKKQQEKQAKQAMQEQRRQEKQARAAADASASET